MESTLGQLVYRVRADKLGAGIMSAGNHMTQHVLTYKGALAVRKIWEAGGYKCSIRAVVIT